MRPGLRLSAAAIAAFLVYVPAASAGGNAAVGKMLATTWCSSCHLVSPDQTSATTEAPPFESIAERSDNEIAALALFLADPHPPMPQMSLTRQEIQNLLAYIGSLKR